MREQNLKVADKDKLGTVSGSAMATSVALSFKSPHVNLVGCDIHKYTKSNIRR